MYALRSPPAPESLPTVVIVDDDGPSRVAVDAVLTPLHLNLVLVPSAEEALTALSTLGNVVMIVTDMRLQGISGAELAARVRQTESCRDVPILIVSGVDRTDAALRRAIALPSVGFLQKPYETADLRALVARAAVAHA